MKDKIRESGQVVMSIRNLHGRCVTSFKVKHRDQRDKAVRRCGAHCAMPLRASTAACLAAG